jgi:hypothetical protein
VSRTIPAVQNPVNAGVFLPSAEATAWAQAINLGLNPPRCYVHLTTAPAATTYTTMSKLTWDTDDVDTDTILVSGNKSRLLLPYAGTWQVTTFMTFTITAGVGYEFPQVNIRKNAAGSSSGGTSVGWIEGSLVTKGRHRITVAANDYIEWFYGGSYPTGSGATIQPVAGAATFVAQVRMLATS